MRNRRKTPYQDFCVFAVAKLSMPAIACGKGAPIGNSPCWPRERQPCWGRTRLEKCLHSDRANQGATRLPFLAPNQKPEPQKHHKGCANCRTNECSAKFQESIRQCPSVGVARHAKPCQIRRLHVKLSLSRHSKIFEHDATYSHFQCNRSTSGRAQQRSRNAPGRRVMASVRLDQEKCAACGTNHTFLREWLLLQKRPEKLTLL